MIKCAHNASAATAPMRARAPLAPLARAPLEEEDVEALCKGFFFVILGLLNMRYGEAGKKADNGRTQLRRQFWCQSRKQRQRRSR